jgi:hypothetical protein
MIAMRKLLDGKYDKVEGGMYSDELIRLMGKMMSVVWCPYSNNNNNNNNNGDCDCDCGGSEVDVLGYVVIVYRLIRWNFGSVVMCFSQWCRK